MNIAVWYHCLFSHGTPRLLRPQAFNVVSEAMALLQSSGLTDAAKEIHFCYNGSEEEREIAELLAPAKAEITCHGMDSFAENLTIVKLWEWSKTHPGWAVLYFHAKSATHDPEHPYTAFATNWRRAMLRYLVSNWRQCVADLPSGDIVCAHWLWNQADGSQHIPAGNMLWVKSDFVASLPSMHLRERIRQSGIASSESRYEAEVFWGFGRKPVVIQYLPNGGEGVP